MGAWGRERNSEERLGHGLGATAAAQLRRGVRARAWWLGTGAGTAVAVVLLSAGREELGRCGSGGTDAGARRSLRR
jgi:hypothetical protein